MSSTVKPHAERKHWGFTRTIYFGHTTEVHHASLEAGGFSSRHCHHFKFNDFYVVSGTLMVIFYASKEDAEAKQVVTLTAGERLTVNPNVWHRMQAITDVELVETYWNETINPADIERADEGGKAAPQE